MKRAPAALGVCFDATGTLIEATRSVGEVYHRVALEHGVDLPAWRLQDAFLRILRAAPQLGLDGATREARCQKEVEGWFERIRQTFQATDSTARFADFPAFAASLFDAYRQPGAWRARTGLADVLARLRAAGCPLWVTSNFDHRLPEILEHVGLAEYFAGIEIPSNTGRSKPDRAVFAAVGTAMERSLDELVYVGDDAPETLELIAGHGIRCLDVRGLQSPLEIVEFVLDPPPSASTSSQPLPSHHPDPSPTS